MSECNFKYEHYTDTLVAYARAGYELMDFTRYFMLQRSGKLPDKLVVLRHDIDFSIDKAVGMAMKEPYPSTLFVRLHSSFYNALSHDSLYRLWYMSKISCPKTVGIHVEPDTAMLQKIKDKESWIRSAVDILDDLLPDPVTTASLHCVTKGSTDTEWLHDALFRMGISLVHHQMPGLKYLSDSNGRWREGCFCEWIGKEPRLHVNTHPIWWFRISPQENY